MLRLPSSFKCCLICHPPPVLMTATYLSTCPAAAKHSTHQNVLSHHIPMLCSTHSRHMSQSSGQRRAADVQPVLPASELGNTGKASNHEQETRAHGVSPSGGSPGTRPAGARRSPRCRRQCPSATACRSACSCTRRCAPVSTPHGQVSSMRQKCSKLSGKFVGASEASQPGCCSKPSACTHKVMHIVTDIAVHHRLGA